MVDVYDIGSEHTDTISGKVMLYLYSNIAMTAGTYTCFKKSNADYAVTAGKSFYVRGIMAFGANSGAPWMLYADNAALTTNPVRLNISGFYTAAAVPLIIPCFYTVPASKYVGLYNPSAGSQTTCVYLIGYEA
jgi:hypothetical protein